MKTKFNVGDLVKVRENLKNGEMYYMENGDKWDRYFECNMVNCKGKVLKITEIRHGKYLLEGNEYLWTDGMLERYVVKRVKPEIELEPEVKVQSLSEIDDEIQAHIKAIKKLEKLKNEKFNEKTLILKIRKLNENTELSIYDKDIKEEMFIKQHYTVVKFYRHKNTIEAQITLNDGVFYGEGFAKCHEDDDFDYITGLKLALNRAYLNAYARKVEHIERWA